MAPLIYHPCILHDSAWIGSGASSRILYILSSTLMASCQVRCMPDLLGCTCRSRHNLVIATRAVHGIRRNLDMVPHMPGIAAAKVKQLADIFSLHHPHLTSSARHCHSGQMRDSLCCPVRTPAICNTRRRTLRLEKKMRRYAFTLFCKLYERQTVPSRPLPGLGMNTHDMAVP